MSNTPPPDHEATLAEHLRGSARRSLDTTIWLTQIMVPAAALVFVLEITGLLGRIAGALSGVMAFLELPGEAAVALLTSVGINLYGVLPMITVLELTVREATILAIVTLVAHSFFVELAITKKTGTPVARMFLVRGLGGIVLGKIVAILLPRTGRWTTVIAGGGKGAAAGSAAAQSGAAAGGAAAGGAATGPTGFSWSSVGAETVQWLGETALLVGKVAVLITVLLFVARWLRYVGITDAIARRLEGVMRVLGLSRDCSPPWVVANTLGLTYGAAVLKEEAETGRLTQADGDLLNHHLGISHSLLEDTLLFVAVGVPGWWLVIPRLLFAVVVVWERRLEIYLRELIRRPDETPVP